MDRRDLIASFQDTLAFSTAGVLCGETKKAAESSKIYYENFASGARAGESECYVAISENTTFAEARKYANSGRVAVLNFANPVNPGGGVENGAMAQEECLCRSSNLYTCLRADHLFNDYYDYHARMQGHFYSDRLIYTHGVTVFKDDKPVPKMLLQEDWFKVDVITCAAPYLGGSKYTNLTVLKRIFQNRITNIMEAALDNKVDTIILGAFGCGAFKNPAYVVAEAFKSVIESKQYCKKIKHIIFAIKPDSEKDLGENYRAFAHVFHFCLLENSPYRFIPAIALPTGKIIADTTVIFAHGAPYAPIEEVQDGVVSGAGFPDETWLGCTDSYEEQLQFLKWQRSNPFYKKQISILGDSISTLDGYNPEGYNLFFAGDNCTKAGVQDMSDTWWGQVINLLGAELLINNSWSGSRVSQLPGTEKLFPSGCSDERTSALHMRDTMPDVIIVYLGTNDWGYGVTPEPKDIKSYDENELVFSCAYETMVKKLQKNYPHAKICCCTLNTTFMSANPGFSFPAAHGGVHIDVYNNIIRSTANRFGCKLIDLAAYHKAYDSIDGSHPNANGMKTLATMVLRELDEGISTVLDCEQGHHNYILAERSTGDDKYVCSVCCKVKHEGMKYMKKIVKAHISFSDGYCGRSITLDGNTLSWKNTHYPGPLSTPDYDCSEKKIELSDVDVQLLSNELSNVDISECISDSVIDHPAGASYSIFTCTYEDGSEIEYKTRFKPAPAFELLKRILNRRCGLPVIPIIPPLPLDDDTVILDVPKTDEDVIKIDPNVTDILYPDTLKLFVCSSSKTITLQKARIEVGRSTEADLNFGADNKYMARRHATFMFSNGKWYLVDNNSTNGTYINGVKLQPGKKYQLAADDEIVFAGYTKLIFYKTPWEPIPPIAPPMPPHKPPFASSKAPVPPSPVAPIQLGAVIDGKYKLERILAAGPHTVYLATVEGEDKKVAIKVEDISGFANKALIANIKESFELHKAIKHPDVPSMLELIQTSKYIYLVMDYLDGETLDRILDKSGPMESKRVAVVGRNIAKILKSMHELKPPIICRDVKPSNIMIHNGLDVNMFDFGIAMRYYDDGREDEHIVGTVGYAAPEQYEGHARPESDIYGLGMTLYYMLTKDDPKTPGFTHRSIRELNPKTAPELERIVEKCIEPDYKNRYRSCDALIRDLDHFINGGTSAWLSKLFRKK